jgi:hypothetical protein
VFGDHVAGVAVAGHGRGTTDGGQGDGGEQAGPDTCPPRAHGRPGLFLVVEVPGGEAGDGVVHGGGWGSGSTVTAGSDSSAVSGVPRPGRTGRPGWARAGEARVDVRAQGWDPARWVGLLALIKALPAVRSPVQGPALLGRTAWENPPHHGSRYTSVGFLAAVAPRAVLVSVGAGNRYGHPNTALLGALEQAGAAVRRTDTAGDIAVVREPTEEDLQVVSRGSPLPAPR